jgi:hypothetical protein
MSSPRDMPPRRAQAKRPGDTVGGQRFGRITDRRPTGSGDGGHLGTYFVRDDETGATSSFDYADIVTEGFRTIRTGERVRFLTDPAGPGHAIYVIRLDLPDVEEFYA